MGRALVLCLFALVGCNNGFDPASYLSGLRVVAIKAEPPELAPGQTSTLKISLSPSTSSDENADGGLATVDWALCLKPNPGASSVVDPDCINQDNASYITWLGSGESVPFTMPMLALPSLGVPDSTTGLYVPIRARVKVGGQTVTAVYRLRYSFLPLPPNQNPVLSGVFVVTEGSDAGGEPDMGALGVTPLDETQPFPFPVGHKVKLRATLASGSDETFMVATDLTNTVFTQKTELPRFFWYSTFGEFSDDVTGEEQPDTVLDFDRHPAAAGDNVDIYAVVVDDRGGIDIAHRVLTPY